jgi:photosystem II stability/assembly factor-like uncharacterized protein
MKKYFLIFSVSLLSVFLLKHFEESAEIKTSNHSIKTQNRVLALVKKEKKEKKERMRMGYPDKHAEIQRAIRTAHGQKGPTYQGDYQLRAFQELKNRNQNARSEDAYEFIERGPGNIAGRTRAFFIDASDASQNTWFVGAASGGIWKTMDGGATWATSSNGLPNLGTNALAQATSNPDIMYAGTGELNTGDQNGSGLFKSIDHGQNWFQTIDPEEMPALQIIGRIIVNPADENEVVVSGRSSVWSLSSPTSGIYKSTDGGTSWEASLLFENGFIGDMVISTPNEWDTQYASIRGKGVYKSTDGGQTWTLSSSGISNFGRIELAVSPIDPNIIWASEASGQLYISRNGAETWSLMGEVNEADDFNFLKQGSYDNAVMAHPFDSNKVYVAGVDIWEFTATDSKKNSKVFDIENNGSEAFMSFINFSGTYLEGILEIGEVGYSNSVKVEVRFGQGTQKAHRFSVGGAGSGVPDASYQYEDYVEVPFQIWDVDNDQQLMVSFRDQQEDSVWNLIPPNTDGLSNLHSREYLFIHLLDYAELPDSAIALDGGHTYEQLYFIWPVGIDGYDFDPLALPNSEIRFGLFDRETTLRETYNISDAYGEYDGNNSISQYLPRSEDGIHPDHHSLHALNINLRDSTFNLLSTNDGGIYLSKSSKQPGHQDMDFEYVSMGYNATQFYSADKMPGEDRYIGGMQDNGTYLTPEGISSNAATHFDFALGGDGFEVMWNNRDPLKIMGSIYYNSFASSHDGGKTWSYAVDGIAENDGPFLSRLASSRFYPDRLYGISQNGVYISNNFGDDWSLSRITSDAWYFSNFSDIEVSAADANIVWVGSYLSENERLFVSTDKGLTFTPTETYLDYPNMGPVTALGSHPDDPNTAFAIFSIDGLPKILKTKDLGQTWLDISGFDPATGLSDRGFPNVASHSFLCFPNDPDHIWVGTEIGIIETSNGGDSWALVNSNMPMVKVLDMKIQDDQIILATYGRGIWSVTIPEIEQEILFAPNIEQVSINPEGLMTIALSYSTLFDSTQVIVDGDVIHSVGTQDLGAVSLTLDNLNLNGMESIKTLAYKDGKSYESLESQALFFDVFDVQTRYSSDFSSASDQLVFSGFKTSYESGFPNIALHTTHPHPSSTELISVLKTPIQIKESDATLQFKEIVIVETGETGTSFGDDEFWDYVIVEGSTDGLNWTSFLDGYDSDVYPEWASAYNRGSDGDPSLYKTRTIDMLETFDPNDVVLIRFRLFADAAVTGWGWAIDDLAIQEEPLGINEDQKNRFSIYPNPMVSSAQIVLKLDKKGLVKVLDLQGKLVRSYHVAAGTHQLLFERGNLKAGIYLVSIEAGDFNEMKKILIQ